MWLQPIRSHQHLWRFLLGSVCSLFFFFFGNKIGILLFHNPQAGRFLKVLAFVCPFLYLNTTLASILNGVGKSGACLFHSIAGIFLRILFVFFLIPRMGIRGYFYGLLFGEILLSFLYLGTLFHIKLLNHHNSLSTSSEE